MLVSASYAPFIFVSPIRFPRSFESSERNSTSYPSLASVRETVFAPLLFLPRCSSPRTSPFARPLFSMTRSALALIFTFFSFRALAFTPCSMAEATSTLLTSASSVKYILLLYPAMRSLFFAAPVSPRERYSPHVVANTPSSVPFAYLRYAPIISFASASVIFFTALTNRVLSFDVRPNSPLSTSVPSSSMYFVLPPSRLMPYILFAL